MMKWCIKKVNKAKDTSHLPLPQVFEMIRCDCPNLHIASEEFRPFLNSKDNEQLAKEITDRSIR